MTSPSDREEPPFDSTGSAAALRDHLRTHLTDGWWHDDCSWCVHRRRYGGTGVVVDGK